MKKEIKIEDIQMNTDPYPNWKRGVKQGLIASTVIFIITFAFSIFISRLPAISPVSLSMSFRPWWRLSNWVFSFIFGFTAFLFFGAGGAYIKTKLKR